MRSDEPQIAWSAWGSCIEHSDTPIFLRKSVTKIIQFKFYVCARQPCKVNHLTEKKTRQLQTHLTKVKSIIKPHLQHCKVKAMQYVLTSISQIDQMALNAALS